MKKIVLSMALALSLTACFTDSEITNDEEHYEAEGLQLVNEEDESVVAEVVADAYTASANDTIILSVGDTIHLEAKLLCAHEGELEHCDEDEHEDHDHAKLIASEDDHDEDQHDEDDHDDHSEEALTMKISLSDSSKVGITEADSELYHIGLKGLEAGKSVLSIEFWHGSHVDIEAKEFVIIVE